MPFTTGSADTAVDLQNAINTHLVANGWTKVVGETSQGAVSPVSARYWRININEPDNNGDFFEVEEVGMYETAGGANIATIGANFSGEHWGTSDLSVLVIGNTTSIRSDDTNNILGPKIVYDFGAPQIVREVTIKSNTGFEAPEQFHIEWSNDLITWTRMWSTDDQGIVSGWANDETKTFTFDTGFLDPEHFSGTRARRHNYATNVKGRSDNGMFVWQGPGYDAARRVYIGCLSNFSLGSSVERLLLFGLTDYDGVDSDPWQNAAFGPNSFLPRLHMPLGPFTYWIYSNSLRLIVVVKDGLDSYHACYLGFMKAFAQPEDYPFPLFIGGDSIAADDLLAVNNARNSNFWDPGVCYYRDWDGAWNSVFNRISNAQIDLYESDPSAYVWPYHCGANGDGNFPFSVLGDNDTFTQHWMSNVVPTVQNELFMWPCLVMDDPYGAVGALDGVFAIPRGGILSAEQVITINSQNYRIFTNWNRSNGNNYVAIRED